eukprot:6019970-Ditylum_brightwellii.AAC.1
MTKVIRDGLAELAGAAMTWLIDVQGVEQVKTFSDILDQITRCDYSTTTFQSKVATSISKILKKNTSYYKNGR